MEQVFNNQVTERIKREGLKQKLNNHDSKILVIYTGGTIGMVQSSKGYIPATNKFAEALKKNPQFHDEKEHSIRLESFGYSEENFITPESFYRKRIIYQLIELTPLIDSSNMRMSNWIEIASIIELYYYDYDGFLILHGTDTMAYTASILSFILENLQKPVILTGSQIPYFEVRNDAGNNFLGALTVAGHFHIPEVGLFFDNKLLRGNRTTKFDNNGFDSFSSPNYGCLVKCGITFKVKWDAIRHPRLEGRFYVQKTLEESISILYIFPIITLQTIASVLGEATKAVVILSYGSGNIPSNRPEFIQELKKATDKGIIILNITQCEKGGASDDYECGRVLKDAGVVLGCDMTLECAVTKLSYLLGKYPNSPDTVKTMLRTSIRGELTNEDQNLNFSYNIQKVLDTIGNSLGIYENIEKVQIYENCLTMMTHNAAYENHLEDLIKMSQERVNLNLKNHDGRTLLHIACETGNKEIVDFLLTQNVIINHVDNFGYTPLLIAIEKDHIAISEKIIERGGEIKSNHKLVTFVVCEAAFNGNINKLKLLVKAGVNLATRDFQGRTAAHAAVLNKKDEVIEFIKKNFESVCNIQDMLGDTPGTLANKLGYSEIYQILTS